MRTHVRWRAPVRKESSLDYSGFVIEPAPRHANGLPGGSRMRSVPQKPSHPGPTSARIRGKIAWGPHPQEKKVHRSR